MVPVGSVFVVPGPFRFLLRGCCISASPGTRRVFLFPAYTLTWDVYRNKTYLRSSRSFTNQRETSFAACRADMQNVLMHAHARALKPGRVHVPRRAYAFFCACRHAHIRAQARAQTQAHTHERTHSCSCYARTDALMRVRTRTCSNKAACMHQDVCAHEPSA